VHAGKSDVDVAENVGFVKNGSQQEILKRVENVKKVFVLSAFYVVLAAKDLYVINVTEYVLHVVRAYVVLLAIATNVVTRFAMIVRFPVSYVIRTVVRVVVVSVLVVIGFVVLSVVFIYLNQIVSNVKKDKDMSKETSH